MLPILFTGLPRPSVLVLQLVQRDPAVVAQDQAANVLADWRRAPSCCSMFVMIRFLSWSTSLSVTIMHNSILVLQVKQHISYLSGSDMKKMPHRPMSLALWHRFSTASLDVPANKRSHELDSVLATISGTLSRSIQPQSLMALAMRASGSESSQRRIIPEPVH
ncbi:uncharacterized protein LOC119766308 [Culex quinquefasciatus]|uniref:uncharacterized protein LOC119766308 n=1 Tax=Culex quinquefasciatus TaxID=7176 RepID=UPI0018E2C119|nr:uncharacterized protein LOC119766308 [Culex quinquefasciatus]